MEIMKFVLGDYRSNCYIVSEGQKAFVIDPGYESEEVIDYIHKNNLILEGIYLTHGHVDHVGGVKQIKDLFGTTVYAPKKDEIWFHVGPYNRWGYEIPVDVWVHDMKELQFLNKKFTVYETPGHSEGSTVLYTDMTLFAGDTLFFQSIGRTDIPFSDSMTIYKSIKHLYELFGDDVDVYPGHGRATTIGHEKKFNPFVRSEK
ncbi:MAG: MBL fold metallo-hydrolase [Firmicutes bacterium]|nr:MBL fold metallo-hydrolase [Bacillota bacterium]